MTKTQNPVITNLLTEAHETRVKDLEKSIAIGHKALSMSLEEDDRRSIAQSLSSLSLFFMIQGSNDESIKMAEDAIKYFEELEDEIGIANAKYSIAGTLYKTENFNLGQKYLRECLSIYKKHKDYFNEARTHKSMGTIYEYFGDTDSAILAYERCIEAGTKAADNNLISNAYNPLSGIHLNKGEIDKALDLIEKSISMKTETQDIRGLAFAYYGRGKIFIQTKEFEKAEADFLNSMEIHRQMGERLGSAMCLRKMGKLYLEMTDFPKARAALNEGLEICDNYKIALIKFNIHYLLYELSKVEGNEKEAMEHLENYVKTKDEVINTRMLKVIETYESVSQIEKFETEAAIQKEKTEIVEKKNLELDSFFYRVSHDMKGSLNAMTGLDFMSREVIKDPEQIEILDQYKSQTKRMGMILDKLIQITRMNHLGNAKEEIDFQRIVDDCIDSYSIHAEYRHVEIIKEIEEGIHFKGEWALVNTIIQNLVENGLKYSSKKGDRPKVSISIVQKPKKIRIQVSDNGQGLSEESKENIFQMFYQSDSEAPGTGLGLFILKKAVDKLRGTVSLDSELGKGTTFSIFLPLTVD